MHLDYLVVVASLESLVPAVCLSLYVIDNFHGHLITIKLLIKIILLSINRDISCIGVYDLTWTVCFKGSVCRILLVCHVYGDPD